MAEYVWKNREQVGDIGMKGWKRKKYWKTEKLNCNHWTKRPNGRWVIWVPNEEDINKNECCGHLWCVWCGQYVSKEGKYLEGMWDTTKHGRRSIERLSYDVGLIVEWLKIKSAFLPHQISGKPEFAVEMDKRVDILRRLVSEYSCSER